MSAYLTRSLAALKQAPAGKSLTHVGMGIEKESLRINPQGQLAQTPHPEGLGAPLTHPSITTDFSEALLEFITPVFHSATDTLAYLQHLHTFTYGVMDPEELLWIASMPCILGPDEEIPLAQYGNSNIAKLKTLYRSGLSYRYGRAMQAIAGIHFNFSLSDEFWESYHKQLGSELSLQDFKTEQYFHLIRNFKRYSWLLIYLFGASPAVCNCFVEKYPDHGLEPFQHGSLHAPYGTSLRMGDLGYTSEAQSQLYICYNGIEQYAQALTQAIRTPYDAYRQFSPQRQADGSTVYKQVNDSILQIENEFYSTIRPKRVTPSGAKPVKVLQEQGVEYIEVRCLDLNPFMPLGIDEESIHFLTSFLIFCLLEQSPKMDCEESAEMSRNITTVVREGRKPGLQLQQGGNDIAFLDWASELMQGINDVCRLLDELDNTSIYSTAFRQQAAKIDDSSLTPSAKILQRMSQMKADYFRFAMDQSLACSDYFRSLELPADIAADLKQKALQSIAEREEVEASDTIDFDTFLKQHNDDAHED